MKKAKPQAKKNVLDASVTTGVDGLDSILSGGYPAGRSTIIRGVSGSGKTLFGLLFALCEDKDNKPAVYVTFDESPESLERYLKAWGRPNALTILDMRPDPELQVAGNGVELGGLLVRISHAVAKTGAKRLVLDAFDTLFSSFEDNRQVRLDLARVFDWCRKEGLTVLATTGESPDYRVATGLMDYVADCAIRIQQSINNGLSTRVLHILKCRGRAHGTSEYPFLIHEQGISLIPLSEVRMKIATSRRHLPTGVVELDKMLGGKGIWGGRTTMISGQSGTGKSLLAMTIVNAACEQGKKAQFFTFEESENQAIQDNRSCGVDLRPHLKTGMLEIHSRRAIECGLEEHIIHVWRMIIKSRPSVVVLDPVSSLTDLGDMRAFKSTVIRLSSLLNGLGVTLIMTELIPDDAASVSMLNVSSMVDTWIRLRREERDNQLVREIYIHKSRGAATSSDIREMQITHNGIVINAKTGGAAKPVRRVTDVSVSRSLQK
ncbi:MAG: circadian clock protein KaiC [Nitrospinae bacterium CG11_big_fil_rev_8_21_14_0_20_56_8]|nr:MAG: circadian clock protein KaiC [Nitrospinae bacterium CG11_big_fil_rev_8_21_14_0_20_56_8]